MPGEGLGRHLGDTAQTTYGPSDDAYDVAAVGDLIVDRRVPLTAVPDDVHGDWQDEPWYPGPGESMVVDDVPAAVDDYVDATAPGGKGPNQATAAARAGADTALLGEAGGHDAVDALADDGVATDYLAADGAPGAAYLLVDEDGDNRIPCVLADGEEDRVTRDDDVLRSADIALLTNGEPDPVVAAALDALDGTDTTVVYDPSPIDGAAAHLDDDAVDIATPNEHEYAALEDAFDAFDGTVIETRADGAIVDGTVHVRSPAVDPVDTTAAGDTFNGYLAADLADGADLYRAVEDAVHAASLSVTREGARPAIPSHGAVAAFRDDCA